MLQRGHSGDGCDLASTLCEYDLRKGDLFVLSWAVVRRVRRVSISSELPMCGGGVHIILLLPLVARILETIDVCIWRMFVFMYDVVNVWGLWEFLALECACMLYVCVGEVIGAVFSDCIVTRGDMSSRVWEA